MVHRSKRRPSLSYFVRLVRPPASSSGDAYYFVRWHHTLRKRYFTGESGLWEGGCHVIR